MDEELELLWPQKLMQEIARKKITRPWAGILSVVAFCLMAVLAILMSLMQLILLVVTNDKLFVSDGYYPTVLRISLLVSGALAAMSLVAMIRAWVEQAEKIWAIVALNAGTLLMGLVIWLLQWGLPLEAHQTTPIFVVTMVTAVIFALVLKKYRYEPEQQKNLMLIIIAGLVLLAGAEGMFDVTYVLGQRAEIDEKQEKLEALGRAQMAARVTGVAPELSDLMFTICDGQYDVVQMLTSGDNDGLFECKDSHLVYAATTDSARSTTDSPWVRQGLAFYFGTVDSELANQYFTKEMVVKYLYRDLTEVEEVASEMVLLVPAMEEELAVSRYLDAITGFVNAQGDALNLSVFYTPETNGIVSTKDFILLAAMDTLANLNYFPRGAVYDGYVDGAMGKYIIGLDGELRALNELGKNPTWYASQTLDALSKRRHINVTLEGGREYSAEEMREILYQNWKEPKGVVPAEAQ